MPPASPPTWRTLIATSPLPATQLRWWLAHTLSLPLTQLPLDTTPTPALLDAFHHAARRLAAHEPVQYICGTAPFMDFDLLVSPDVLIPRPETEQLVHLILSRSPHTPLRAADIGTGSACIAIALQRARPRWSLTAIDISEPALALARQNAERLHTPLSLRHNNLLHGIPPDTFDLIAANLPYIDPAEAPGLPPEVRNHEPHLALFAEEHGTALIHTLLQQAKSVLSPRGTLYLETGETQTPFLQHTANRLGWTLETLPDLAGRDRFQILTHPAP